MQSTGEKYQELIPKQREITSIKIDSTNNLIISASGDSSFTIQKENKTGYEIKRSMKNCFDGKPINFMEVSVYHNIIAIVRLKLLTISKGFKLQQHLYH